MTVDSQIVLLYDGKCTLILMSVCVRITVEIMESRLKFSVDPFMATVYAPVLIASQIDSPFKLQHIWFELHIHK